MTAARQAITFDFHNTIASCDSWFQIEIRRLVSDYLRWDARENGSVVSEELCEAADAGYRQLRQAIHIHGHELSAERCVAVVLDKLDLQPSLYRIKRGVDEIMVAAREDVRPIPGVLDTIRGLAASDVPLAIVSSAVHHDFLEWSLNRFGIRDAFATVVTSASVGYYKSRPEIYWNTLDRIGADHGSSIHVGDSRRFDVIGARAAGMGTALYEAKRPDSPLEHSEPDLYLPSLVGATEPLLELRERFRDRGTSVAKVPTVGSR
jgi:FMN phosphatase YigB (HAD superfamily)